MPPKSAKSQSPKPNSTLPDSNLKKIQEKYQDVIQEDTEDPEHCFCMICAKDQVTVRLKWISIKGHMEKKHSSSKANKISIVVSSDTTDNLEKDTIEEFINLDETGLYFRITKFILEHNLSFSIASDLLEFIKTIALNFKPNILLDSQLSTDRVSKIANKSIADDLRESIYTKLSSTTFSLSLDASSDIFGSSYLAITSKFLNLRDDKVPINPLVSIISINESSNGETLFNKVQEKIFVNENIIHWCCYRRR